MHQNAWKKQTCYTFGFQAIGRICYIPRCPRKAATTTTLAKTEIITIPVSTDGSRTPKVLVKASLTQFGGCDLMVNSSTTSQLKAAAPRKCVQVQVWRDTDEACFRNLLSSNDRTLRSLIPCVQEVIWGGKFTSGGKLCPPHQASKYAVNPIIPEKEQLPLLRQSGNGFFVVPAGDQSCLHEFPAAPQKP